MSYHEVTDLTGNLQFYGDPFPCAAGGYADVYRAYCGSREVAVKVMRITRGRDVRTMERKLIREMTVWSTIEHQHVLPFMGYCRSIGEVVFPDWCFVSPWMAHGVARSYLEKHPDANRLQIVFGVASGLYYLHLNGIVHGDIKGDNVLINHLGTPLLCDFGLALFSESPTTTTLNGDLRGSPRWMAYELIMQAAGSEEDCLTPGTPQSDTWSFASTLLELFTLKLPYHTCLKEFQVLTAIMARQLPFLPPSNTSPRRGSSRDGDSPPAEPIHTQNNEPSFFAEVYKWPGVWPLCKDCWNFEPRKRPSMGIVVKRLGEIRRRGPYDAHMRPPPHNSDLYGPKRPLSPSCEDGGIRKSPRVGMKGLPDVGQSPLRNVTFSSPSPQPEVRARTPRSTPNTRTITLSHDDVPRKPRQSKASFSSNSGSTSSLPSNAQPSSSSGHSSHRPHPYHSSIFKSNRPGGHRRSPSSGTQTPPVVTSVSAPPSLGPSRVSSDVNVANLIHTERRRSPLGLEMGSMAHSSLRNDHENPIHTFPQHQSYTDPYNYDSPSTSRHASSNAPYREGASHEHREDGRYHPHRYSTLPTEFSSSLHSSPSHHLTPRNLFSDHYNLPLPPLRQESSASTFSDSLPHSPSPQPSEAAGPRIVDVHDGIDMHDIGAYSYSTDHTGLTYPQPCSQPYAQHSNPNADADVDFSEYINLSQSSSPNHSPQRTQQSLRQTHYMKSFQRRISDTFGFKTGFLEKYSTQDDMLAQPPSPTEGTHPEYIHGAVLSAEVVAPLAEQYAASTSDSTRAHNGVSAVPHPSTYHRFPSSSPPQTLQVMTPRANSAPMDFSSGPQYAEVWTASPGMKGRGLPDDTPSLKPNMTLLAPPSPTHGEYEEVFDQTEDDEAVEEPPDSMESRISHDFDEDTDVEPDEDDDPFNAVIPLGYCNNESRAGSYDPDRFSESGSEDDSGELENGVSLFGGRVDQQYWRQGEEDLDGRENGHNQYVAIHSYSRDSTPTPRAAHRELMPATAVGLGLGIKI